MNMKISQNEHSPTIMWELNLRVSKTNWQKKKKGSTNYLIIACINCSRFQPFCHWPKAWAIYLVFTNKILIRTLCNSSEIRSEDEKQVVMTKASTKITHTQLAKRRYMEQWQILESSRSTVKVSSVEYAWN